MRLFEVDFKRVMYVSTYVKAESRAVAEEKAWKDIKNRYPASIDHSVDEEWSLTGVFEAPEDYEP